MIILQLIVFIAATYFGYKLLNSLGEIAMKPLCFLCSGFMAFWLVHHLT